MIYLGKQNNAFKEYSKNAICWLNIKIKGRKSVRNQSGFRCKDLKCTVCGSTNKNNKVNSNFRNLFNDDRIERLITAMPQDLLAINDEISNEYIPPNGERENTFEEQSKILFVTSGYTNFFQKYDWNYKLASLINRHTCTYCNREYIFVFKNTDKGKGMVPQFDHWFAKEKKPLLAISFFNLIPSCATCNGIKSSIDMNLKDHLHPYVDEDISKSYEFSYLYKGIHFPRIVLKSTNLNSNKGKHTFEALNLPLIYEGHSDKELKDLYDLRFKYSENYLNILLEKTFNTRLGISDQEKYRLIFGIEIDEENYHKRIMSKFKKDIIRKLLSIK